MITDRIRFTVLQVNSNDILTRDLVVQEEQVMVNLSGPSRCSFKLPQGEQTASAYGIDWKTWGQWIIPEIELNGVRKCLGAQLVNKADIDPKSGTMYIEGIGFLGYPKSIPWLENFSPIAVDPAEVIQRVWAHLQNFTNANLGIEVLPASTGTQMLPGYSFDGSVLNFDFFAMFIREVDFQDCGDVINSLARDIPLDMLEEVAWTDSSRTSLSKVVRLGYPYLGYLQEHLAFILGENVITAEKAEELEIEPVSDVIIRSWRPGKTKSARLNIQNVNEQIIENARAEAELLYPNNPETVDAIVGQLGLTPFADPSLRARRVIMEEDANIDSTERAAAWAKRRLTRRNIPLSFQKIVIDPSHPNAPIESFWLGDTIYVEAKNYPWVGDIAGWHRVTGMTFKGDEPFIELQLKTEGAFNYDPIIYDPNYIEQPTEDHNLLANGYFAKSMSGWITRHGQWFRVTSDGRTDLGCVRVDCDDAQELLESHKISVDPGATYNVSAWVKRQTIELANDYNELVDGVSVYVQPYFNGGVMGSPVQIARISNPEGTGPWTELTNTVTIVSDGTVNEISVHLSVTKVSSGITWWDDVKVVKI